MYVSCSTIILYHFHLPSMLFFIVLPYPPVQKGSFPQYQINLPVRDSKLEADRDITVSVFERTTFMKLNLVSSCTLLLPAKCGLCTIKRNLVGISFPFHCQIHSQRHNMSDIHEQILYKCRLLLRGSSSVVDGDTVKMGKP